MGERQSVNKQLNREHQRKGWAARCFSGPLGSLDHVCKSLAKTESKYMLMFRVCSSFICAVKKLLKQGKVTKRHLPWILCPSRGASAEIKPKPKINTGNMVKDKNLDLQWEGVSKKQTKIVTLKIGFSPKDFFNWIMAGSPWLVISLSPEVRFRLRVEKDWRPRWCGTAKRKLVLLRDFSHENYFLHVIYEGTFLRFKQGQKLVI